MNYITRFALAPRFNCVEGIILKSITFNFHRKFFATLIPDTREEASSKWKKKDDGDGTAAKTFPHSARLLLRLFVL
jgi:hypothetical protein